MYPEPVKVMMAFVLLVATAPARADVIVFNDLADTLSVSGSTRVVFNCPAGTEMCTAARSAPAETTFKGSTRPSRE